MCHLLLLMPVLALPLFWVLPLDTAALAYGAVVVVSVAVYIVAMQAMRRPVQTGMEELLHSTGEVVGRRDGLLRVRVGNEYWSAESPEELRTGERIRVLAIEDMRLQVRRSQPPPDAA